MCRTHCKTVPRFATDRWPLELNSGKNSESLVSAYYDAEGHEHFQKAKAIIVAGYAIETPRLLLNSACRRSRKWVREFERYRRALSYGAGW